MSDNGPHMQPPHSWQGGGQPPSGPPAPPPGQPPGGPQYAAPQYGTQPPPPGDPYARGPAGAPQYPPPPGQPPYPSAGAEMPGSPPAKSNLGLILVIIGGVVIIGLIIVVLVMLLRSGDDSGDTDTPPPPPDAAADDSDDPDDPDDSKDDDPIETAAGDPPHELPEDECLALGDDQVDGLSAEQTRTSSTDNTARCSWDIELEGFTGTLDIDYQLPYSASDSVEAASSDFEQELEWMTDEDSDILDVTVHENDEIDLGDEANLIFSTNDGALGEVSTASLITRQDNMLVTAELRVYPDWISGDESAPLEYDDISDLMPDIGASAINNLG